MNKNGKGSDLFPQDLFKCQSSNILNLNLQHTYKYIDQNKNNKNNKKQAQVPGIISF